MKGVAEGHDQVGHASGCQHALDFRHHALGPLHMLQHGIALDALEHTAAERQLLRIGRDIDAGKSKQVDIHVPIDARPCSAEVQIPPAERRVNLEFTRVPDERIGRAQPSGDAG